MCTGKVDLILRGSLLSIMALALPGVSGMSAQQPDLTIGVLTGPEPQVFGHIRDVVVNAAGDVFVLDNQASEVRWFDSNGTFRGRAGTNGSGPGELRSPQGLGVDGSGDVLVLDPLNARISRYRPGDTGLAHVVDVPSPPALDLCAMDGSIFLLRMRQDSVVTVLDGGGRVMAAWGSLLEPLPGHDLPPDEIRREQDNRARMLCDPATSTVTLLHERIPVVRRFSSAGVPIWEVELADYHQALDVRTPDESDWTLAPDPETGTAHSGRKISVGEGETLLVSLYEGSAEGGRFEVRVLARDNGEELRRIPVPMVIESFVDGKVVGHVNSPIPRVLRFDWEALSRR
jgi:hypothetical protein